MTLREPPAEAEVASHQLLLRAGYIRQLGAGIFSLLPLGLRSVSRIAGILREEMNAIGGQEMLMPVVHPAEVWKESGRWYTIGSEMGRFLDRSGHDMVLALTHEEVVANLVRGEIRSYRQLPALIYHIQTKWRDDPRPRAGLIRAREFTTLDSYSLDADEAGLEKQYQAHYQAYLRIFQRCGLEVAVVQSDTGMMGGQMAHEFMYLTPAGEDTLLFCRSCGYAANRQVARFRKPTPEAEAALPLEKVATPGAASIEALANFLNIPKSRTAKAVFLMALFKEASQGAASERLELVFAVVRGDMEVNETKLANLLGAAELRPANAEEIQAVGAAPGYASPVGLTGARVVVDDLIPASPNLVAGANQADFHLRNVNYGRDFTADLVGDIAAAGEGSPCPNCGGLMASQRGVAVGNILKLGTRYSQALGCEFTNAHGEQRPLVMGCYGIGLGRLLACAAEMHHDERGLKLPASLAPYPVHLVVVPSKNSPEPEQAGERLYRLLCAAGLEPLYDDRPESAGVKFMDADLIGLPLRLTLGERSLAAGGVEFKARDGEEKWIVPAEAAPAAARKFIDERLGRLTPVR